VLVLVALTVLLVGRVIIITIIKEASIQKIYRLNSAFGVRISLNKANALVHENTFVKTVSESCTHWIRRPSSTTHPYEKTSTERLIGDSSEASLAGAQVLRGWGWGRDLSSNLGNAHSPYR
jgi:hypothetical protein